MSELRTLTCEEALRMLAEHLDGELHESHQNAMEAHLRTCRSCFSRAEFERRLKAQIGGLREKAVRSDFETAVRAMIGRFVAGDPAGSQRNSRS